MYIGVADDVLYFKKNVPPMLAVPIEVLNPLLSNQTEYVHTLSTCIHLIHQNLAGDSNILIFFTDMG